LVAFRSERSVDCSSRKSRDGNRYFTRGSAEQHSYFGYFLKCLDGSQMWRDWAFLYKSNGETEYRKDPGVSIGEVARGLEVNPNVLHRWRREFRQGPGNAFPAMGRSAGARAGSSSWNGRSANRPLEIVF
jgi:hypothetical protein